MNTPQQISNYRESVTGAALDYIKNGATAAAYDSKKIVDCCNYTRKLTKTVAHFVGDVTIQTASTAPTGSTDPDDSDIALRVDLPKDLQSGSLYMRATFEIATGSVGEINNFRLLHQSSSADATAWDSGNLNFSFDGDRAFQQYYKKITVYPNVQLGVDKKEDPKQEQWLNVYWDATTLTSGTVYPSLVNLSILHYGYDELTPDYDNIEDLLAPYPKINSVIDDDYYYTRLKNAQDLIFEYETTRCLFQYPEKLTVSATSNILGADRYIIIPVDSRDRDGTYIKLDVSFYVSATSTFQLHWRQIDGTFASVKSTAMTGAGWLRFIEEIDISAMTRNYIELKITIDAGTSIDVHCLGVKELHYRELHKFA